MRQYSQLQAYITMCVSVRRGVPASCRVRCRNWCCLSRGGLGSARSAGAPLDKKATFSPSLSQQHGPRSDSTRLVDESSACVAEILRCSASCVFTADRVNLYAVPVSIGGAADRGKVMYVRHYSGCSSTRPHCKGAIPNASYSKPRSIDMDRNNHKMVSVK